MIMSVGENFLCDYITFYNALWDLKLAKNNTIENNKIKNRNRGKTLIARASIEL